MRKIDINKLENQLIAAYYEFSMHLMYDWKYRRYVIKCESKIGNYEYYDKFFIHKKLTDSPSLQFSIEPSRCFDGYILCKNQKGSDGKLLLRTRSGKYASGPVEITIVKDGYTDRDECMLFRQYKKNKYEIFISTEKKTEEQNFLKMLKCGALDEEIQRMKDNPDQFAN